MKNTEETRKLAYLLGTTVEELDRRERVGLSRQPEKTDGGFVMCRTRGDRMDEDEAMASVNSEGLVKDAREQLEKYLASPLAEKAHENLARASALLSAALARHVDERAAAERAQAGRGSIPF